MGEAESETTDVLSLSGTSRGSVFAPTRVSGSGVLGERGAEFWWIL